MPPQQQRWEPTEPSVSPHAQGPTAHHDGDVVALVVGQGPIHAQQQVLGLPEAAEVLGVQPHDHGDVVHSACRDEGLEELVQAAVPTFLRDLQSEESREVQGCER